MANVWFKYEIAGKSSVSNYMCFALIPSEPNSSVEYYIRKAKNRDVLLRWYVELLRSWGFDFEMKEDEKKFTFCLTARSKVKNLIILTAIRYAQEFPRFVAELKKNLTSTTLEPFEFFQFLHHSTLINANGHSLLPYESFYNNKTIALPMSLKDFAKQFKNKSLRNVHAHFLKNRIDITSETAKIFSEMMFEKRYQEAYELIQRCATDNKELVYA
jgi:hypothetical protein